MYDLIYAGEHRRDVERDILGTYPEAEIQDASGELHRGRFEVTANCDRDEWRMSLFLSGNFDMSFEMECWRIECPEEYLVMMREAVRLKRMVS